MFDYVLGLFRVYFNVTTKEKIMIYATFEEPSSFFNDILSSEEKEHYRNLTPVSLQKNNKFNASEGVSFRKAVYKVTTDNDGYRIYVEMPGVSKSDIEASVDNNYLEVLGHRNIENDKTTFYVKFKLSDKIYMKDIAVRYDSCILTLFIPLKKNTKRIISVD